MPGKAFLHDYDFDPGYGMDLGRLLDIDPPHPPADFADFWRRRFAAAMALAPKPRTRPSGQVLGNHAVHELRYGSTDGVEIGGWLLLPLATPWDRRIGHLCIEVPTFGHHGLRMVLPSVGSCDAVRNYQRHHSFDVMETLVYYDAACAARNLRIPTLVAAALFDPAVPPPGQFAIYNAIPASRRRLFLLAAGHFDYPGRAARERELAREAASFLT